LHKFSVSIETVYYLRSCKFKQGGPELKPLDQPLISSSDKLRIFRATPVVQQ